MKIAVLIKLKDDADMKDPNNRQNLIDMLKTKMSFLGDYNWSTWVEGFEITLLDENEESETLDPDVVRP